MALPESETIDHPRKREESHKTQTAIEQLNYLATCKGQFNYTTIQLRTQHKTPHKSEENQAIDIRKSPLYTVCGHLHLLQHLW